MTSPTIALCVPAYQAEALLPRLFASVRGQTVPFDETWVYDDASTDRTALVAARLGAEVVRGDRNLGCSAGKNALLTRVGTEFVHFHDADDELYPELVERAKVRLERDSLDVLLFNHEQVDERTGRRMGLSDFDESAINDDPVRYALTNTINNCGVYRVARLREAGGFDDDPAVRFNEDRAFHLRLATRGLRFGAERYVGSRFNFRGSSMSSDNRAECCEAQLAVTMRFALENPSRYERELIALAWRDAACLSSFQRWEAADRAVRFATRLGGRVDPDASVLFGILCAFGPCLALRVREWGIRLVKPGLRRGYPGWSALRGPQPHSGDTP